MKLTKWMMIGSALYLVGCATTTKEETATEDIIVEAPEPVTEVDPIREKYETIEYGQALDFVCTDPVPAEGKLADRPNLQEMWENYLYDRPEGIWGEIGGMVEVNGNLPLDQGRWTNACTVRVSHMLNQAGHKIPRDGNKTVSGGNKDQYYYRIRDFEAYMTEVFGEPDLAITDGSADSFDLPPRPGLLVMDFPGSTFNGHTTIWNGAGSVDNADIGGHRVLFWDLPCFVPEGRDQTPVADNGSNAQDVMP